MTSGIRVAVLGGSSPFTCAFFEALADQKVLPEYCHVMLHGRDELSTALVAARGARVLGDAASVAGTTDLLRALDGATIVVHQVRYHGLEGREEDERLAARIGVAHDETLGPGGLVAAMRLSGALSTLSIQLARHCPDAVVMNLTNPLSISTSLLAAGRAVPGGPVVGICELPLVTATKAASVVGRSVHDVQWSYSGLNHRGFVHDLRHDGRDLLPELIARLTEHRGARASLGESPANASRRSAPYRRSTSHS